MDSELQLLIRANAPFFQVTTEGRIECTLNGHTFPPNKDAVEAFINGKKFPKLKRRAEIENELAKYEPFLQQSINFPTMLFCSLTNQLIDKRPERIQMHMKGRRFKNAKERFLKNELELWVEPSFNELEAMGNEEVENGENDDAGQEEESTSGSAGVDGTLENDSANVEGESPQKRQMNGVVSSEHPAKAPKRQKLDDDDVKKKKGGSEVRRGNNGTKRKNERKNGKIAGQ